MFESARADAATRIEACLAEALAPFGDLQVAEAMRHALNGGKRLRGFLVLESAALFGVGPEQAVSPAAAIEALHAYSLVHDDLPCMDDDDLRRGQPTVHVRWDEATAVLAGDAQTGVALMRLEEGLDTGPVAAMQALDIGPADTAGELHDRLARLGADLLMAELDGILDGRARFVPQPATGVTHAPKITKAEAIIDWREPAVALDRRIRAFNPWPVAETRLEGQQLRCWLARPQAGGDRTAPPGRVLAAGADGIDVQTGDGVLRLLSVQLAGRQRVAAGVFANGFAVVGRVLGA